MKQLTKYIFIVSLVVFAVSCLAPMSKESYLEGFERFVDRVEKNHEKYNKKDWEWANSQFQKYNGDWYEEYCDEFTLSDQLKIKSFIIRYYSYQDEEDIAEILEQFFKEDLDEVREKIQEYIANDLDEDIEVIIDGAAAIGDSAVKVLEDIIKELEESF